MKFLLKPSEPARLEVDVLVVFCWEEELLELKPLDVKLSGLLFETIKREGFEGKEKEFVTLSTKGYIEAYKLVAVGLGKKEDFNIYRLRQIIAQAVKKAKEAKPAKLGLVINDFWLKKLSTEQIIQTTVETVVLADYRFLKYKAEEEKKIRKIEEVELQIHPSKISQAEEAVKTGKIYGAATCFARDLVNEPAAVTTPSYLAQIAANIGKESKGKVKVQIFEKEQIKKLGMRAYLGVAQGSAEAPKFIKLTFKPAGFGKKVVIVGKGITFDTGGLSLKSSKGMETMKLDMSGAASVLAVFSALTKLSIKTYIVGLIPACENMPSGRAIKPGDILRAANNKTIEVISTDAEGRLTLADAFAFAKTKVKPDYLIDLATLTGACRKALGEDIAGLWGNNVELIERIKKAAEYVGEKVWQMPLEKDYRELIISHIADVRNAQTGKYGQAITAALFLSEFVGDTPWAHLDIAGPAYMEKETALIPKGGSGFAVSLLLRFLKEV